MVHYYSVPGQQNTFQTKVIVSRLLSLKENLSTTIAIKLRQLKQPRVLWVCKILRVISWFRVNAPKEDWKWFRCFSTQCLFLSAQSLHPAQLDEGSCSHSFQKSTRSAVFSSECGPLMMGPLEETALWQFYVPCTFIPLVLANDRHRWSITAPFLPEEPRTLSACSHYQNMEYGIHSGTHPPLLPEPMMVSNRKPYLTHPTVP